MKRTLTALILSTALAGPLAAQGTPPAGAAGVALPAPLSGLGLTEVRTRPDDDGELYIYARTPAGGWIRAEAWGDRLIEVQADGPGLPQALVEAMLPAAVLAEPRLADIARLTEIDLDDDGGISVEGYGADGMRIEIEFSRDGRLLEYERERDDRRSMSEEAARARLAELGYTGVGFIARGGRHVTAMATNPFGDTVEVRLDEQGRVERERLWRN